MAAIKLCLIALLCIIFISGCSQQISKPMPAQGVPSCDDSNACTIDSYDPSTGCTHTPKVCDDSNACTVDTCDPASGECSFIPKDCDDGDPNTLDSCDTTTGECIHTLD